MHVHVGVRMQCRTTTLCLGDEPERHSYACEVYLLLSRHSRAPSHTMRCVCMHACMQCVCMYLCNAHSAAALHGIPCRIFYDEPCVGSNSQFGGNQRCPQNPPQTVVNIQQFCFYEFRPLSIENYMTSREQRLDFCFSEQTRAQAKAVPSATWQVV